LLDDLLAMVDSTLEEGVQRKSHGEKQAALGSSACEDWWKAEFNI
jgi:hypothetical protein